MSSKTLRCALMASFTLDTLPPLVREKLNISGISSEWFVAPFNQYPQLILAADSALVADAPHIVFVAVAIEDLLENLPSAWAAPEKRRAEAARRVAEFMSLMRHLTERLPAVRVFVHDFVPLVSQPLRTLAEKVGVGWHSLALQANVALAAIGQECPQVHIVHLDAALASMPRTAVTDSRFFYHAKMRLGRDALDNLANEYARLARVFLGLRKKCIVLDLDNTLWGGVLGEEGMEGILLSDDGPGKAFQDLQRVLLEFYETGTLLGICSKNDEPLAMKVIREHPAMLLRPHHFAAMRINWQDKASNIIEMAHELNLGLDSFVFLDDSEFERADVQRRVPQVTVVDLPGDYSQYPEFVSRLPFFDALTTTEDDRRRGQMYVEDRERRAMEHTAESLEDFLRGLNIQVVVQRSTPQLVPRLAQLSQRTNQFNLTSHRYTESDLLSLQENQNWRLYAVLARDRIGDSGMSGAAFVEVEPATKTARLDTFLVSCRVLGRGIESAFLAGVCSDLQASGITTLVAEYVPTEKNGLARDFLSKHGFQFTEPSWRRALDDGQCGSPAWIQLKLS